MNFDYSKLHVKENSKIKLSDFPTIEDGGFTKKTAKEEIKKEEGS